MNSKNITAVVVSGGYNGGGDVWVFYGEGDNEKRFRVKPEELHKMLVASNLKLKATLARKYEYLTVEE